jgi:hypothetical protein
MKPIEYSSIEEILKAGFAGIYERKAAKQKKHFGISRRMERYERVVIR